MFWLPKPVFANEGVCEDDELFHDGSCCDFGEFAFHKWNFAHRCLDCFTNLAAMPQAKKSENCLSQDSVHDSAMPTMGPSQAVIHDGGMLFVGNETIWSKKAN